MKELQTIIETWRAMTGTAALATVVHVKGSAYRRAGARMLVTDAGTTVGGISGGCLEADVILNAQGVMRTGHAKLVCYDSTDDRDLVFGVGLGCNGVIHIVIEPIQLACPVLEFAEECIAQRRRGVVATVFRPEAARGSRLLLDESGFTSTGKLGKELISHLHGNADKALQSGISENIDCEIDGEHISALIEVLEPPPSLVVFGAGYDAMPVVRLANELGWRVSVIDDRTQNATSARFPQADLVTSCSLAQIAQQITCDDNTLALVMTHSFLRDLEIVETIAAWPLRYLGILGPKRRSERIVNSIAKHCDVATLPGLQQLRSPAGLDIGAETPEEIALSIIAEMKATLAERQGGFLRDRRGPIHEIEIPRKGELCAR